MALRAVSDKKADRYTSPNVSLVRCGYAASERAGNVETEKIRAVYHGEHREHGVER
ncbi:hypothetical protein GCM10007941_29020 [Amphritea balenae]|nr:hypothetical protein GCM10007941_29020 [Amphritea balenae]